MDGIVFLSHRNPFIKLSDHLKEVSQRVLKNYKEQKEYINLPIDEEFLKTVSISHDFGKYTTFFQKYIVNGERDKKNRHHHGFISALFGAWLSKDKDYLPLIAYFVIKHHHGDLKNLEDDLDDRKNLENLIILDEQIEDIKKNKDIISCEYSFSIDGFLEEYRDIYERLKKLKFQLLEIEKTEKRIEAYFSILYVYSLLIDNDKKAASKTENIGRKHIPEDLIENYRRYKGWENPKKDINNLRNELYFEVRKKVSNLKEIPDISTITAPTGFGKTLINLDVALRFRKKLKDKPRIIYSLPFISIIDQTYKLFDEILYNSLKEEYKKNESLYLIKHHHLADTKYKKENEERPVQESLLLIEGWDAEIVITTFVQFLHSVIAFKNNFIKKFHNIVGSIIILDEVQTINIELWNAVEFVLKKLTEVFNCKIILSTATKPLIFENYEELVENNESYFTSSVLKRTQIIPKIKERKTVDDFLDYFLKNFDENIHSYLIVLNTIKTSIQFFEKIREEFSDRYAVFYLSTNIVPVQRKVRTYKIKKALEEGKKVILVSTQVVEAGIDLDFEKVFRDIAPVDSIIQVAGRCNRNGKHKIGDVEVHRLFDENTGREYSKMIYGSTMIDISLQILSKIYKEDEYKKISDTYFRCVKENKSQEKSKIILKDIKNLSFYSDKSCIARDFSIIEEAPYYRDIFIEINGTAQRIYQMFKNNVVKEKNFIKKIENYIRLKKKLKKYIISVPQEFLQYSVDTEIFPRIPLENLEDYYDKKGYGFKRTKEIDVLIF